MSPTLIIFLLLFGGVVLLVAEMFLPAHGVIGAMGVIALLGGVGYCFSQNQWAGAILLVVLVCLAPIAGTFAVKWWPRTPLGKKIVLQPLAPVVREIPVQIGQTGQTLSALRPTGMCEFGGQRLEARSELGIIEPGKPIKVVAVDAGRITVRGV
jgi:membrane-bound ClpP family serine protease